MGKKSDKMHIVDMYEPERVDRKPDQTRVIFTRNNSQLMEFVIFHLEMRLYTQNTDEKLGPFSLITVFVDTDMGSIEMLYDEGYRGHDALDRACKFITYQKGLSSMILRATMTLRNSLRQN